MNGEKNSLKEVDTCDYDKTSAEYTQSGETYDSPDVSIGALVLAIISIFFNFIFIPNIISLVLSFKTLSNKDKIPFRSILITYIALGINVVAIFIRLISILRLID